MMTLSQIAEKQAEMAKQTLALTNTVTLGFTAPLGVVADYFSSLYVESVKRFEQNVQSYGNKPNE